MKARLKITVLIFLVAVWFTEGLTWNTEIRSNVCCQGNNQLLIWNFTKRENEKVTGLYWFLNEKTLVCLESDTTRFVVASDLYEGRVERNGAAGILLKNVSLNDTGEYNLYVKLEEEKERNVQGIDLTVVEPPPSQCKPIIKKEHLKGILSCSTACERSPLSVEWIINGTNVPKVIGPYLVVDPLWTSEQPVCCLRDFKCVDDYQSKFCTPNNFSFTDDLPTVNQPVADTNHIDYFPMLISLIVTVILIAVITLICVLFNRRRCKLCHKRHYATSDDTDIQLHERLSGQPLQDSNQQDQIANNSNRATDLVQSLVNKISTLEEQLKARDKEIKELRIQLRQERDLRKKEKGDSDFTNNDTDTFNISESEDASSELPSAPMLFHSESQGHSSGC